MRSPRLYRVLLLLLPAPFRRRHGPAMETAFADARADARRRGVVTEWMLWLRELVDLTAVGLRLRWGGRRRQGGGESARGGSESHGWRRRHRRGRWSADMGSRRRKAATWWTRLRDDLVFAVRSLRRNLAFTAFAASTLALGVGAATAMFSAVDGVMLHPLPFPHADRMVTLWRSPAPGSLTPPTDEQFRAWRVLDDVFEDVEPYQTDGGQELTGRGDPRLMTSVWMRGTMPAFLGVRPVLGRSFTAEESADSTSRVLLISSALWKTRFGGSRSVLGRTVDLDGKPWTIIGVMPPGLGTPDGEPVTVDLWQPLPDHPRYPAQLVARLREGVGLPQAQARIDDVAARHVRDGGETSDWKAKVSFAGQMFRAGLADSLRVLMAAVTLLLLVACVNVANLLLSRAQTRRHEMAVCAALGAEGGRLIRQTVLESVLLGAGGGALGVGLAWGALRLLEVFRPDQLGASRGQALAALGGLGVDGRVVAFAAVASIAASLLFAIAPAVHATGSRASAELTGGRRTAGTGRSSARFRWTLVAGEVALSFALLVGSVTVVASLRRLASRDPGFETHGLVDVEVQLPSWSYRKAFARRQAFDAMRRTVSSLPEVKAVSLASGVPPQMGAFIGRLHVDGVIRDSVWSTFFGGAVGARYLDVIGEPILLGRNFTDRDVGSPERPVIIGQSLARKLFPDASPLGHHLDLGSPDAPLTVVGVVRDVLVNGLSATVGNPIMYTPMDQVYRGADLVVRERGEADAGLLQALRQAVRSVEPDAVVLRVARVEELMGDSLARQRFTTSLLTAFGILALLLSAVGLYGVVAQAVGQRTREIGIRMSLGAVAGDIRRMVLSSGAWATAAGLVAGVGLTLAGMPLLSSQVFGLEGGHVGAYAVAAAAMALTVLLASWVPARRATRVDPVQAIRTE